MNAITEFAAEQMIMKALHTNHTALKIKALEAAIAMYKYLGDERRVLLYGEICADLRLNLVAESLVQHHIYKGGLHPITASLYEYLLAGNGLFLRAERDSIEVMMQIVDYQVRGLSCLKPYLKFRLPKVPASTMAVILDQCHASPDTEALWYLRFRDHHWEVYKPIQQATNASVHPITEYLDQVFYSQTIIEIHSHHRMEPEFSSLDDEEENGFRIYAIIGNLDTISDINARVCVAGHCAIIDPHSIFELPDNLDSYLL